MIRRAWLGALIVPVVLIAAAFFAVLVVHDKTLAGVLGAVAVVVVLANMTAASVAGIRAVRKEIARQRHL